MGHQKTVETEFEDLIAVADEMDCGWGRFRGEVICFDVFYFAMEAAMDMGQLQSVCEYFVDTYNSFFGTRV